LLWWSALFSETQ